MRGKSDIKVTEKLTCLELRSAFWSEMLHLKDDGNQVGFKEYWPIWRKDVFDAEKFWPMKKAYDWLYGE